MEAASGRRRAHGELYGDGPKLGTENPQRGDAAKPWPLSARRLVPNSPLSPGEGTGGSMTRLGGGPSPSRAGALGESSASRSLLSNPHSLSLSYTTETDNS